MIACLQMYDWPAVHATLKNATGNGQRFYQFTSFNLREVGDALNRVLIHCVAMVHIELHHRDNRCEFRNKSRQYAQFVHAS